jgi:MFS family permease
MNRSIFNVLVGTFTLRFSTGLTGGLLVFYLAELPKHGGEPVSAIVLSFLTAFFFITELGSSPIFGLLSDRLGHHRVMQYGPVFGAIAATLTGLTTNLPLLSGTRVLEGGATGASVPSILGYLAMATADDEELRGRVSARFELATLAGIGGGGFVAAPILWAAIGPIAFFLNALIYVGSLLIYRFGVAAPDVPVGPHHRPEYGWQRYARLLKTSHVWLLAPTWIAVNAAIGVYATQGVFNLVRERTGRFPDQLLAGGLSELEILVGGLAIGAVFFAGLIFWGNRFKRFRRTSIIFYGIVGGAILVLGAMALNHSGALALALRAPFAVIAGVGVFILAGATPAALGLLADMSEAYPDDRGAVMGLYSVFLGVGQIAGAFVGGVAAEWAGVDGLLVATLLLMGVALLPLYQLRQFEHHFEPGGAPPAASTDRP